jgi:dTDP-glucose pyrophosphorylase
MNNISKISDKIISINDSIVSALKKMDGHRTKLVFVFDGDKFESILTIGDIQRAIIRHSTLTDSVSTILDKDKIYASDKEPLEHIKEVMMTELIDCMPVLNEKKEIVDVFFWHDVFDTPVIEKRAKIDLPVIIMAGGNGTRLKPITNVIPKPLVPVGDKTILEVIMDQFESIGCHKFYMSVNYKADMMKYYLSQLDHKYDIEFFMEDKPLGTIGSVSLLKGKITTPFFVSNCDSINEQDYRDVYDYHVSNNNDLTIVTMVKTFKIPYGVIETGEDGLMTSLSEKPELTYQVNTGVYILNPSCINEIPEGEFFHITHLMEKIKAKGGRVGCFPVSEHSWKDMGEWPEYLKMINVFK